ncbi:MAG TPA: acryloyl-CoA reductase [Acidimicrobiales bacterium]|nr:acryloyl-CoA reductase [Acidimicrobiales bacterium]
MMSEGAAGNGVDRDPLEIQQRSREMGVALPEKFSAYLVTAFDDRVERDVSRLRISDLPAGELLIRVRYSAVNFKDGMVTQLGNRVAKISPLVPGVDLAGEVVTSSDPDVSEGQVVQVHGHELGVSRHGGFSEFARVPSDWALPVPEGLSARDAMVVGTAGFTAALSLEQLEHRGLKPGQGPVLVTGASGGVGSLSVALLASKGYEVVASTGKEAESEWLESLGATRVIGRNGLDIASDRTLGPEIWSGAVDPVGGRTLSQVLRTLRYGAAVAASGLTGGSDLSTTVYPFIVRAVSLVGIDTVQVPRSKRIAVWARLAKDLKEVDLNSLVASEVSLGGLSDALAQILNGGVRGRIVVNLG